MKITHLKVNHLVNPMGYDLKRPSISYVAEETAGKHQAKAQVKVALDTNDKNERDARMQPIIDAVHEKYDPEYPEQGAMLDECLYKLQKKIVRNWLYEGKRVDGRGIDEIRPPNSSRDNPR